MRPSSWPLSLRKAPGVAGGRSQCPACAASESAPFHWQPAADICGAWAPSIGRRPRAGPAQARARRPDDGPDPLPSGFARERGLEVPSPICQSRGDHPHPHPRLAGGGDGPPSPIPIGDSAPWPRPPQQRAGPGSAGQRRPFNGLISSSRLPVPRPAGAGLGRRLASSAGRGPAPLALAGGHCQLGPAGPGASSTRCCPLSSVRTSTEEGGPTRLISLVVPSRRLIRPLKSHGICTVIVSLATCLVRQGSCAPLSAASSGCSLVGRTYSCLGERWAASTTQR
jgi:hypothetical protein